MTHKRKTKEKNARRETRAAVCEVCLIEYGRHVSLMHARTQARNYIQMTEVSDGYVRRRTKATKNQENIKQLMETTTQART